jgi:prophage regulatory protein
MEEAKAGARALRIGDVCLRVGMSRAWVYDQVMTGSFPRPIKLGSRASAWLESEVEAFLAARAAQRDRHSAAKLVGTP